MGPMAGSGSVPLFLGQGQAPRPSKSRLLAPYPDPSQPLFFSWGPLHCRAMRGESHSLAVNVHPSHWHFRGLSRPSLHVYGTVMHVNRGNPASQEVVVDSWPEFKIVLTRPNREVTWDPSDFGTNLYTAFYRDEGACRALLGNSHAVDWSQAFQIQGLQDGVYETIRDIARARGHEMKMYPYLPLLHPDPPSMPQYRSGTGVGVSHGWGARSGRSGSKPTQINNGGSTKKKSWLLAGLRSFQLGLKEIETGSIFRSSAAWLDGALVFTFTSLCCPRDLPGQDPGDQ
ncbi:uncharacterized protein LOC125638160 isoform X3 [Caretta caretta]|uniref:uncharacterized protein LOC125638160 isoform X3 n=1 Tax=Caretta caretta TaxID=8467 RepID=UPI003F4BF1C6